MKIRLESKPLRRDFRKSGAKGLLLEKDIAVRTSRLKAKLLVFDSKRNLRQFWTAILQKPDLGRHTLGAVNALGYELLEFGGPAFQAGKQKAFLVCDPRYFCVIGLVRGHLSMEIISHEAVHAGFCYAKRRKGDLWLGAKELDEENVCYPAGIVAAGINRALHKAGLYDE